MFERWMILLDELVIIIGKCSKWLQLFMLAVVGLPLGTYCRSFRIGIEKLWPLRRLGGIGN